MSKPSFLVRCSLLWLLFFLVTAPRLTADTITVITFEALPNGTTLADGTHITTQFPNLVFSNATVQTAGLSLNEFEFPPHSGSNVVFDDGGAISITFLTLLGGVGGFFTYLTPLTLVAFDGSNNPVSAATSAFMDNLALSGQPGSNPNEFLGVLFPGGISQVTITGDPLGGSFTLDDLTIRSTSTAVPEPSTHLLLLTGLITLACLHKKFVHF